jgi:hypothetical protein
MRFRVKAAVLMTLAFALTLATLPGSAQSAPDKGEWRFAVSGDSRNCGDVVMPGIAAGVLKEGPAFYWHLGDFRKI